MNQHGNVPRRNRLNVGVSGTFGHVMIGLAAMLALGLSSCDVGRHEKVEASQQMVTVGVTRVVKKTLSRQITLSSQLVPFQEIDVYAKESGYVQKLSVDYGTHV